MRALIHDTGGRIELYSFARSTRENKKECIKNKGKFIPSRDRSPLTSDKGCPDNPKPSS